MHETREHESAAPRASLASRTAHAASLMLLLATIAWGAGFTWAKEAQAVINQRVNLATDAAFGPLLLLAIRFFVAAALLLVLVPSSRRGWTVKSVQRAFILGAMLGLGMNLQHLGLSRTSEAVTAFLTSLTILFVPMLMTVVWRKPPAPIFWIAVALATLGVWLMTGATAAGFGIGELFGVGCAIVFSVYLIVVNDILPRDNAWRITAGMFIVAGVFALVPSLLVGPKLHDLDMKSIALDSRVGLNFALLVIFPTIFSYVVMNLFQPRIDPTRAALIYLLEPIFASVYAWLARGATLTSTALVGAALILVANGLVEFLRPDERRGNQSVVARAIAGYVRITMDDLKRMAARMLVIGFDGLSIPAHVETLVDRGVGGAVLFARNVESPEQVAKLCAGLKRRANRPFITCIDQEGGRVARLREGFTEVPSMRTIGRSNGESRAYEIGQLLARELRAVNIDLDFAPVLDVDTNPDNPVIADRSFSSDPAIVSRLGAALIRGLQDSGVAACGKHFPGHGDTSLDSHLELPHIMHGIDRLSRIELPPFEAAIRTGVASIMTAHIIYDAIDPRLPATMNRQILHDTLRKRLGFDGVLFSDDMEMKAIASHFDFEESIITATNAGVDMFLVCHTAELQDRAIEIIVRGVETGTIPRARIEEANRRINVLFERFVRT